MSARSCRDRVTKKKVLLFIVGLLFIVILIYVVTKETLPKQRLTETSGIDSDEPAQARFIDTKDVQQKDPIICSASPVVAAEGGDVTLDCHLQPEGDVTGQLIEWRFNKDTRVLVHRSKDFSQDDQDKQFRGRATLGSSGNLSQGKIPVKIRNVTKGDAGNYSCSVGSKKQRISCSTELTVEPKLQHIKSNASKQRATTLPFVLAISTFLCLPFY